VHSSKDLRTSSILLVFSLTAFSGACGSVDESPVGPTPVLAPAPSPDGSASFSVTVTPNPVPWSSEPVANCNLANRWHYDQILRNTGSVRLTVSDRSDFFDGANVSSRNGLGIVLEPGADTSIRTRWCSATNAEHRAQTNWTGSDDSGRRIDVNGTIVRLLPG
jgi:hypothetical protein